METICQLDEYTTKVARGRYAGKKKTVKLFLTASKYCWDISTESGNGSMKGEKFFGGFNHLLPSAYDHFNIDPIQLADTVEEALGDVLDIHADEDAVEGMKSANEDCKAALSSDNKEEVISALKEFGDNLNKMYYCHYCNAYYEKNAGNVYDRVKESLNKKGD